ncbi:ABC transporter permease [Pengzhenrongella sicca]|uniref:FtsX-like permease family protein n=1 Tax=Pengzhenrongella sicca TaxID=2819238 RepID=A0A8A4ZBQ6_9MICO|nr:FtsX-like permease family protein [Pengzhenrongella sicca]QTE27927.1 FtsX-like permease family protein [Pengzhenrongella sicca]
MLRLTLAQMRRSLPRLAAAALAIVLGTAFVAATLIASSVIARTSYDAVSASYADADLVVIAPAAMSGTDGAAGAADGWLSQADLAAVRATPGVAAADGYSPVWIELVAGTQRAQTQVSAVASDARLEAQTVVAGELPAAAGEVALPGAMAERLGVGVGDTLTVDRGPSEDLTVVGLLDDPSGAFATSGGAAIASTADAERWAAQDAGDAPVTYARAVVAVAAGTDVPAVQASLAAEAPPGSAVRTKDEQAKVITTELTNGSDVFTAIVLGFAAIAMLVAALVIANTFQVLIAQRTRTLALLRCVGADKRQLRRSVLIEAGLLGGASSALGLALGVGLAQLALTILGNANLDVPLPSTISITPAVVLAPLVIGTLVTVLASLAPARAATQVAPLAALRPAEAPVLTERHSRPRLVAAALLTVAGTIALVAAVALGTRIDVLLALALGIVGGALSFTGVLIGSVFWVPTVVGAAGHLLAPTGTAARLAAANTVRNPRRTAATSTALLIGVTLVTMMSTGAASARSTMNGALDDQYPVDVIVSSENAAGPIARAVGAVPGIADTVTVPTLTVTVSTPAGDDFAGGDPGGYAIARVIAPTAASTVIRATSMLAGLTSSSVSISAQTAASLGITDGDVVTMTAIALADDGADAPLPGAVPLEVTAVVTDLPEGLLMTPEVAARLTTAAAGATRADAAGAEVWARLSDVDDASTVVPAIEDSLSETSVYVSGAVVERALFQRIIDTLLAVVVGLLAVAVVIALIGVANTLSLSVLERRRESATLRALGLTRRQLRLTLAIEGMLIAGVGAVLGAVLGTLYGWAGAGATLAPIGTVKLEVPWRDLALVVLVSLAAGLLASILPGRAAARTSPVAALAVE